MDSIELKVPDMACAVCAEKITKAVQAIAPEATVTADPATKLVNISSQQPESAIKSAITAAGYTIA